MDAAALTAVLQQMQATLLQQQHDMQAQQSTHAQQMHQQQQALLALQQQQVAQSGAAPVAAPHGPQARIPLLERYEGDQNPHIDAWTADVRQQFSWYRFVTDEAQVRHARAHLRGPAFDWLESLGAANEPTTWAALEAGLRTRFQPVTTAQRARAQLDVLHQGKGTIYDYVAAFRRIAVALPMTDPATMLHAFHRGLTPFLARYMHQVNPATIEDAISLVVRMGTPAAAAAGAGAAMDLNHAETDDEPRAASSGSGPVSRDEWTALLNALQSGGYRGGGDHRGGSRSDARQPGRGLPVITGMTPAQVNEHMEAGKCFGCHHTGHSSRNCHLRVKDAQTGKVSWPSQKN